MMARELLVVLMLLGGLHAAPAPAQSSDAAAESVSSWEAQLAQAHETLVTARTRFETADAAYTRARHNQYPRGEALAAIEKERTDAAAALEEATRAMPELLEEARRAGVPQETLDRYAGD